MMPVDWRTRMSIITGTTKRTMTAYSRLRRNAAPLLSPLSCRTIGLALVGVRAHDKFRRGADTACVYAAETGIKNLPPSAAAPKKRENCMRLGQSPNPTGVL